MKPGGTGGEGGGGGVGGKGVSQRLLVTTERVSVWGAGHVKSGRGFAAKIKYSVIVAEGEDVVSCQRGKKALIVTHRGPEGEQSAIRNLFSQRCTSTIVLLEHKLRGGFHSLAGNGSWHRR